MAPSYASMASSIAARSLQTDIDNVKASFSSWDNCMSKAYCKWPVVAAIIIASLIVLLVVSSIVRCLCCGVECCCGCFACFNACCPSPRGRRSGDTKYIPAPQPAYPPPQNPYYPQAGMNYGAPPQQPQFATFDANPRNKSGAAINGDTLPPMPSWDTAQSRRVIHDDDDLDTEYHGTTGEQSNGDIALGGMATSTQQDHEQRQPMLPQQITSPSYNNHPAFRDYQEPANSGYPYQTQGAYAGGDLGGPQQQPTRPQQPSRYDSTYSAIPPSYRSAPSPSPYAHGYGNAYNSQQYNSQPSNNYTSYDEPSSTAYGGAPRQVRFGEEPAREDLFYPPPASRGLVPSRRPVGGGDGSSGPAWF